MPGADAGQGVAPSCIDWAAMTAIFRRPLVLEQGHVRHRERSRPGSCKVADVAAQLKVDLARTTGHGAGADDRRFAVNPLSPMDLIADAQRRMTDEQLRSERINALRTADLRLQRADLEYATRRLEQRALSVPRGRAPTRVWSSMPS